MDIFATYTYNFPTRIRFGKGVVGELPSYLKELNLQHPLVVTDPTVRELAFLKKIIEELDRNKIKVDVFSQIHKNPVKSDVHLGSDFYHKNRCDSIIGIGGGAALDVARAVALKVNHEGDLFKYEESSGGEKLIVHEIPHFITIPTTSGTGSEVGRSAIISDDVTKEKKILFHPKLLAKIIFADPELTMDLPPFITAATGMDALAHNLEAYVAKGFHPMCEGIALEGIRLISESLETAVNKPDLLSRGKMQIASLMGAVAFQKGLGAVHSTAHPMSSMFDTHHGLAVAIMLSYGVEYNSEICQDKYKNVAGIFKTNNLVSFLKEFNTRLGLPTKLSSQNIDESHLKELARLAFLDFCHPNNPKPVTESDFFKIYQRAL